MTALHTSAWSLHDAVFQLARERGLRSFKVECKQGPEGETVIALILGPPKPPVVALPTPREGGAGSAYAARPARRRSS